MVVLSQFKGEDWLLIGDASGMITTLKLDGS